MSQQETSSVISTLNELLADLQLQSIAFWQAEGPQVAIAKAKMDATLLEVQKLVTELEARYSICPNCNNAAGNL